MKIVLWILQVLLAVAFTLAGAMKSLAPYEQLAAQMPWAADTPVWLVRFAGISEVAGGLGLLLPSLLRIKPGLTPLAGMGLATVMVLAAGLHLTRGEFGALVPNAVLGGLALFVAWGRWKKAPISPRGEATAAAAT